MANDKDKDKNEKKRDELKPRQRAILITTMSPYYHFDKGIVEPDTAEPKGGQR
jgi:hypothetical protein